MKSTHSTTTDARLAAFALLVAFIVSNVFVPAASGAGYALHEQGSRALGTAGAFAATADDPSAIFYNPAGLAGLDGTRFYAGVSPIVPKLEFGGASPYPGNGRIERFKSQVLFPIHAYVTTPLRRGVVGGIGVSVPFGLAAAWEDPAEFSGRFISTDSSVRGVYVTPTIAAEVTPTIWLGAGLNVIFADAALHRHIPLFGFDSGTNELTDLATLELQGDLTVGFSFNAGLLYKGERWRLGLAYRHGNLNEIEGDVLFDYIETGDAATDSVLSARVPSNQRGRADVPFPATGTVGLALKLSERFEIETNLIWTDWSAFDTLPLTFDDSELDTTIEEDYDDTLTLRSGIRYQAGEKLELRAGYYVDDAPAPSASVGPILPDARRHGGTLGFGYTHERWRLDLFEMLLFFEEANIRDNRDNFNGDYSQRGWLSGVSIGYAF